jgi:adenine phosphoribosyltransferase
MDQLKRLIREVPDFPKPGILFYDITTLLEDPMGLKAVIDGLTDRHKNEKIDKVIGVEARGFIFAPAVAYALNAGFVPVRKPGKLPFKSKRIEYALEYGTDALEIHVDAVKKGERVLIVDDLLATGGTTRATADLVQSFGAEVAGLGFVVELDFLRGREKLSGYAIESLVHYAS